MPTLLILRSFVTAQRSLSRPVALSNAFVSDAWPSSILRTVSVFKEGPGIVMHTILLDAHASRVRL